MGAWEPFHFGLLGLNYNCLHSLLKLQILVCVTYSEYFLSQRAQLAQIYLNGKKYSVLSYLVPLIESLSSVTVQLFQNAD